MSRPAPVVRHGTGPLEGLEIHVAPVTSTKLVADYHIGHPALAPFYAGHPYDIEAYRRKAAEVTERLGAPDRERIAPALHATSARAAERLRHVLDGRGFVVTTGQQAGLFGGPLYTVYKALSAVRLAARLERELGTIVVPVFWIAADDHDFDEIDHIVAIDEADALQRIAITRSADAAAVAMAEQPLGADVGQALDAFAATLPGGPFAADALARLRAHYRPGRTVADAFEATMTDLLAPFDAVIVASSHAALKEAAVPVLERELSAREAHGQLLLRASAALEAAGYDAQVPIAADVSNVFHQDESGRDRLVQTDDGWHHRRSRSRIPAATLERLLHEQPSAFSPNVLLRPVVESALLPTLAYVAGPAELAYFAQIGCLFRAHGIQPPVVFPRPSVTLVTPTVRRLLDRHGLEVSSFQKPASVLVSEAVHANLPPTVVDALARIRTALEEGFRDVADAAVALDPTLAGPLDGVRRSALGDVDAVEKKIVARLRTRADSAERQILRAAAHLHPLGNVQERRLNIFSFLARFGPTLTQTIEETLPIELGTPAPDWRGVDC